MPRFTPEGVTAIAQWGLLALIGYWVLTVVLRLLICVVRKVFWVVKTVLALWLFGLIVTDKNASADTTAVRVQGHHIPIRPDPECLAVICPADDPFISNEACTPS